MKILQIIPDFNVAGAETMCVNLLLSLRELGQEVCAVSLYTVETPLTKRLEAAGVRVRMLDKKPGPDLSLPGKLCRLIREERPDVVHTHLYASVYAQPAAWLGRVKVRVHTVHNVADKEAVDRVRRLNRIFFRRGHVVPVALSGEIRRTVAEEYGLAEKRIPVIPNGIDLGKCLPKESHEAGEPFTLCHAGRFSEQKNHALLLEAFALFAAERPEARLVLAGEGKLMERTRRQAEELGLKDKVVFAGLRENIYPLLQEADLFVLPSDYEGMPMTLIEAMGTALPIIATAVGGVPELLDGGSGLLVPPGDAKKLAEAMGLLAGDPELRSRLGRRAAERAKLFSSSVMAEKYLECYRKCLKE